MVPLNQRRKEVPFPTRDDLQPFIEASDVGGHWYWTGAVRMEGIDPWPAYKTVGGSFIVIRLLLGVKGLERPKNTCGLRTCVNPEHWEVLNRVA